MCQARRTGAAIGVSESPGSRPWSSAATKRDPTRRWRSTTIPAPTSASPVQAAVQVNVDVAYIVDVEAGMKTAPPLASLLDGWNGWR